MNKYIYLMNENQFVNIAIKILELNNREIIQLFNIKKLNFVISSYNNSLKKFKKLFKLIKNI